MTADESDGYVAVDRLQSRHQLLSADTAECGPRDSADAKIIAYWKVLGAQVRTLFR